MVFVLGRCVCIVERFMTTLNMTWSDMLYSYEKKEIDHEQYLQIKGLNKGLPGTLLSLSFNYVPGSHSKIEKSGLE